MEIPLTHGPLTGVVADATTGNGVDSATRKNGGRIYHTVNLQHPLAAAAAAAATTGTTGGEGSDGNRGVLRCCFISDPDTDKSAASICVNVGQLHDASNLQGIAHLTEHLLFMGSQTFPKENDYDSYIQQICGGHTNAYTDLQNTVYYFDVMNTTTTTTTTGTTTDSEVTTTSTTDPSIEAATTTDVIDPIVGGEEFKVDASSPTNPTANQYTNPKLYGALHRLLCAVSEPLLQVSSIEREILAVDSEHSKNISQDMWRIHQLSRTILGQRITLSSSSSDASNSTSTTYHPYANFGTGNKVSLLQQTKVNDELQVDDTTATSSNSEQQHEVLQKGMKDFFHKYYTFDNMTLALIGRESVEELQTMVQDILSKIPWNTISSNNGKEESNSKEGNEGSNTNNNGGVNINGMIPPLPNLPNVTMVQWVPVRGGDCYPLELQWILPVPLYSKHYKCKPGRYFSHLLGHEGPGSLLFVLRQKQWAQELGADDTGTDTKSFTIFTLSIDLTPTGLEHVTDIICMIFYYIDTILKDIPLWVHEELQVTGNTSFQFLAKYDASQTVSMVACNMHQFYTNPNHYLSGPYKIFEYNPTMIQTIGQSLRSTTTNLLILLGSTTFSELTDQTDPWYGTQYRIVPITDHDHHVWVQFQDRIQNNKVDHELVKDLRLPDRNDMLPSDFTLLTSKEMKDQTSYLWDVASNGPFQDPINSSPRCILDNDKCRLWYKPDVLYQTPKVNVLCSIRAPILSCSNSPQIAVMAAVWVEIVSELCNEFGYAASMAGLHCGFRESMSTGSIEVTISGYNHKCNILLQRICDTLQTTLPSILSSSATDTNGSEDTKGENQFFERIRNKIEQRYESYLVAQPYQHGSMIADLILDANNYGTVQDRLLYVRNKKSLSCKDMIYFSDQLLSCFHLEVLVHGNVLPETAKEWANIIIETFQPTPPLRLSNGRGIVLPDNHISTIHRTKGWNEHDENSCVVNIYQIGIVDIRTNAILSLLLQLIREPAFNVLRTEEQLGYIVFSSIKTIADNVKSIMFLIQSDSYDPIHVNDRIENFLVHFRNTVIMEMSNEDFMTNVTSLCDSMLERSKNLSEESMKHWTIIQNRTYYFERIHDIVKEIRTLQKLDILRFFDHYIISSSPYRRKLSIQLFGTAHESIYEELLNTKNNTKEETNVMMIDNIDEFIRCQSLYPTQKAGSVEKFMFPIGSSYDNKQQ